MKSYYFLIAVILVFSSCKKKGCTSEEAINYNTEAKKDDGTCIFLKKGCTDSYAINYDAEAELSDGSCTYTSNSVIIALDHFVDNERLLLNDIRYINAFGNDYNIKTVKYIVSNFKLHKVDGTTESFDIAHLRDVKNDESRFIYLENVPDGYYTGLTFTFGLNEDQNVSNAYSSDNEFQKMDWPDMMGGGYHHMKLEGNFIDTLGVTSFYNTHLGASTSGNNHIDIDLDGFSFTMDKSIWEFQVKMNINNWYTSPNSYDFNGHVNGIMGDDAAQVLLNQNGVDVWSLGYGIEK